MICNDCLEPNDPTLPPALVAYKARLFFAWCMRARRIQVLEPVCRSGDRRVRLIGPDVLLRITGAAKPGDYAEMASEAVAYDTSIIAVRMRTAALADDVVIDLAVRQERNVVIVPRQLLYTRTGYDWLLVQPRHGDIFFKLSADGLVPQVTVPWSSDDELETGLVRAARMFSNAVWGA